MNTANPTLLFKNNYLLIFVALLLFQQKLHAQKEGSVANHNSGILAGCSVLEGNGGIRLELPGYFYSSKRHGFTIALAGKLNGQNPFAFGLKAGYLHYLEPGFRDITFFLNYNAAYYIEDGASITHIVGLGTQIDIGKRGFIQHSIGLGFQQSCSDLRSMQHVAQLKLSIGFYITKMPAINIPNGHEE